VEEPQIGVKTLTGLFGKTRQSYYKQKNQEVKSILEEAVVLEMVKRKRKQAKTSRWGTRKIYSLVKGDLQKHSIKMGRDKLFDLLRSYNMLVKPRKRHFFTTQSHHWLHKYEYLIDGLVINAPNQLWVSDISYVESEEEALYLYLITDAYSQKIVGWHISSNLKAESAVKALKMALKDNPDLQEYQLIHHSDRGVQYCSSQYVELLNKNKIKISMTHPGSPHENSIAERVNGTIKNEWLYDIQLKNGKSAHKEIKEIIRIYNEIRPHQSINYATPSQIHGKVFLRHKAERVMGGLYKTKKAEPTTVQPLRANGPQLSLAGCSSAEPASVSLWKYKVEKNNSYTKK